MLDLHCVPEETKLLKDAMAAGATRVMNGDVMLVNQSAAAFELWTGQKAPVDVIRAAARDLAQRAGSPCRPAGGSGEEA